MEKLQRFLILAIIYLLLWIVAYCIVPTIVFIFGGSFLAVAQSVAYAVIVGFLIINVALGFLFEACFTNQFYSKTK